jgi:integrase
VASVKRRADGKYRARYRDAAGKEHARHFARKVDGQQWLNEQTAAQVTGQYVDPRAGRVPFARYFTDWSQRQVWAPNTDKAMRLAARDVTFADVPLKSLRRSHVETWVKAMSSRGLAPGTVKTRVQNVRTVLRAAVRDRMIPSDPSDGVALPRIRRAEAAMRLPTPAEVRALLDEAEPWFRTFIALTAFAGLRLGEAAAVQVGDINFLGRSLKVQRQVQRGNGGAAVIAAPKYGSERTVFLATSLVELLSRHLSGLSSPWLFAGRAAKMPMTHSPIGYQWARTCQAAGVKGLTLHSMRHFFASGLIAEGCDVVTVQRALGHRSPTVTLATYAHLWPTAEDKTRRAAEAMMAEIQASADSPRTSHTPQAL